MGGTNLLVTSQKAFTINAVTSSEGQKCQTGDQSNCWHPGTLAHRALLRLCVSPWLAGAMFDAPEAGVRAAGGLHFREAQQTTTLFAGGLCNTSLQSPHSMPRQRKVTVGGGVWNHAGWSLAGFRLLCKEQLVAFAIGEEKMEQKWTKVLLLLVFCQRKFAWTLRPGGFVALGAADC